MKIQKNVNTVRKSVLHANVTLGPVWDFFKNSAKAPKYLIYDRNDVKTSISKFGHECTNSNSLIYVLVAKIGQ